MVKFILNLHITSHIVHYQPSNGQHGFKSVHV